MPLDYIIVGAGISGLWLARELTQANPELKIRMLDKYPYVGGRMTTFKKRLEDGREIQWEIGAGRIHKSHRRLLELISYYKLHTYPLKPDMSYEKPGMDNDFGELVKVLEPLKGLEPSVLARSTLGEITKKLGLERIWDQYPYQSEVDTLRADLALKGFLEGEMKDNEGFMIVQEGFGELIRRIREEVEGKGVEILTGKQVVAVRPGAPEIDVIDTKGTASEVARLRGKGKGAVETMKAGKIIFATHALGLADIDGFRGWPVLDYVKMRPLVRVYAAFPLVGSLPALPWFAGIGKLVTSASPIRYFIPVNEKAGTVMISYTDGDWAEPFVAAVDRRGKKGEDAMRGLLMRELRRLFPDRTIPEPDLFKVYAWTDGCTYWLPGDYDPAAVSQQAMQPFPNVYVCGESFSMRQAWIEGALEHAAALKALL
jgi:hypothetical protein